MDGATERELIESAIAAQEQLRATLGDDVVDTAIAAMRAQLETVPEPKVEHERRLVTVVFADTVESTRIFQGLDPEDMLAIMDGALEALAEPVRTHGGRVVKFMGDGLLAVFGLHRTRENDAEMAVRAGLDILRTARTIAADVEDRYSIAGFDVRIGANTGLVVTGGVTEADDTIMGAAVNLASRIEAAAPPGGLLVSQSTYRQVRDRFELEPAGTIHAKGFSEPVPVHLVTGERADRTRQTSRGIDDVDVAMVGRRRELESLLDAAAETTSSGLGRIVTIVGEAGVGKSRLLREFEARLPMERPFTTFRAGALIENVDVPYGLIRDLFERCFEIRSNDAPNAVREKLAAGLGSHLADGPSQAAKIDVIARLLGYTPSDDEGSANPQHDRDRAVAHMVEYFRGAAGSSTVLLLLDDLQWADDGSLAVVRDLLEGLTSDPVLTIALTRPELLDTHGDWATIPGHEFLEVDPLSDADTESLLNSMLTRIDACPPELRARLLEHAGGNPYYLEELVMMCLDDGVIEVDGPAWTVQLDRMEAMRVPTTLIGVIRARLEGLPSGEHSVLQKASVVGRVFWDDAVAHIARSTSELPIDADLRAIEARQMIHRRTTSSFSDSAEYAFSHTLLRDTTYEELLLGARRTYHGMAADWLMTASGDREHEFAGLIATHLEKADRPSEALEYLTRAADAAWKSYAVSTAADLYDRALALAPADDLDRRYELLLGREKTVAIGGNRDEQRATLDELERLADEIGDPARQAVVDVERTFLSFYTGEYRDALSWGRRAVERAQQVSDPALRARAHSALAWALYYEGDPAAARSHGEIALDTAGRNDLVTSEATAQNLIGMIDLSRGDLSEARVRLSRAIELAGDGGDPDGELIYMNNLAVVLMMLGQYRAAHARFSETLERAVDSGDRINESASRVNLAWVAASMGAWKQARDLAEAGLAMKRRQEHPEAVAEALLWLGHALVGLGDLDGAQAAYEGSLTIRRELHQAPQGLEAEAGLIRVMLARGDTDAASSRAEVLLGHIDRGDNFDGAWEPLRIHLTVVEALRAAGDSRSEHALNRAVVLLRENAERLTDADDRRSFEAIPWHRTIEEWAPPRTE